MTMTAGGTLASMSVTGRSCPLREWHGFGSPCCCGVILGRAGARSDERRVGWAVLLSQAEVAFQHGGHHAGLSRVQVRLRCFTTGRDTKAHMPVVVVGDVDHGLLVGAGV